MIPSHISGLLVGRAFLREGCLVGKYYFRVMRTHAGAAQNISRRSPKSVKRSKQYSVPRLPTHIALPKLNPLISYFFASMHVLRMLISSTHNCWVLNLVWTWLMCQAYNSSSHFFLEGRNFWGNWVSTTKQIIPPLTLSNRLPQILYSLSFFCQKAFNGCFAPFGFTKSHGRN